MRIKWTDNQLNLLKNLNLPFDVNENLTVEQLKTIQHEVGHYLLAFGVYHDDENQIHVNETGKLCYSIIDSITDVK